MLPRLPVLTALLALLLGAAAPASSIPTPAAASGRVPKTERDTLLASMRNFRLLLDASRSSLHAIPGSRYPTHEHAWYVDTLAALESDVTRDADPAVAAVDGWQARYDALKQAFVDQMYDACPECYYRDRARAVVMLQLKQDEAIVLDRARSRPGLTPEASARLARLSDRLDGTDPRDVWALRRDLGLTRRPLTTVTTASGRRTFRDQLRYTPTLPTAGARAGANVPPPSINGAWRPNRWVSRANWADYQQLVPWLNNVLEGTGTAALMRSVGIDPLNYTMALISTESSFFHGAVSPSNAFGYMQTLVGTARRVLGDHLSSYNELMAADAQAYAATDPARRAPGSAPQAVLTPGQLDARGAALRNNWKTNVFIGVTYLRENLERYTSRLAASGVTDPARTGPILQGIIASAYNAGEGAVNRYWRRGLSATIADATRSIVPYGQTRRYVRTIARLSGMQWVSAEDAAGLPGAPAPATAPPAAGAALPAGA
jgi:soluble lytic murein transglycosylase-like protein